MNAAVSFKFSLARVIIFHSQCDSVTSWRFSWSHASSEGRERRLTPPFFHQLSSLRDLGECAAPSGVSVLIGTLTFNNETYF